MPRAEIATHQAKFTLDQLHAELTGKLRQNKAEAKELLRSIAHVEAVLKLLDPDYSLRGISVRRRRPNPWFKRGTVWRSALDVLRDAERPLTAREVADRMLIAKGTADPDAKAVSELAGAVQSALRIHAKKTAEIVGAGAPTRWRIVRTYDGGHEAERGCGAA